MRMIEIACVVIVSIYLAVRLRRAPNPRAVLARFVLIATAAWLGENSMIRAYDFYAYAQTWSLFFDRVPLLILLIWPVVIDSAWTLADALVTNEHKQWRPLVGAGFVWMDASLIEPIASNAGLWHWNAPGLFEVPPIGVLGWVFFAGLAMWLVDRGWFWQTLVLAPLGTHVMLIVTWWGALKWLSGTIPPWIGAAVAWVILSSVAMLFLRRRLGQRVARVELWVRVPAAAFFFVLLGARARENVALIVYAIAFSPPYLSLFFR